MDGVDPDTLLEWLQTGTGEERDLQLMALEQLCMLLLMSDNIDRCFESCPPRTFLPALCKIFLDETAPENILEVTARAITYYLDVSNECTRRITQVDGAVKAICNRLAVAEMTDRTSKDLAEQCVKLLEHICQRETSAVYEAGGLQCILHLIRQHGNHIHKDTMHSAMTVITRLCSKIEPTDASLQTCASDLGALLCNDDPKVSECALRCFAALTDRFIRKSLDPVDLATPSNLVEHLLNSLLPTSSGEGSDGEAGEGSAVTVHVAKPASFISIVLSLISNLCRGSAKVTDQLIRSSKFIPALKSVLSSKDERCVVDSLRLSDLLIVLICEGRSALPKSASVFTGSETSSSHGFDRAHRHLIDAIRQRDTDALIDAVENGTVDPNFTDDVGQTLLNWCSAFGTSDMVIYLCDKGADVNKGLRSSSLHYAACFGRADIVKILLRYGANPDLRDEEGKTALDKARERNDEGHQQVVQILESPASYMTTPNASRETPKAETSATSATPSQTIDEAVIRNVLQQLIPVFCNIFQSSLVSGVRRSALGLIRKCVNYISPKALRELLDQDSKKENEEEKASNGEIVRTNFIENFMGVLVTVLEQEDDTDGIEQIIKSLLTKEVDFWLEQLIRLGVFEKIEALAQKNDDISIERELDGNTSLQKSLNFSPANFETASEASGLRSEAERSATSTPSVSLRSEADTTDTEGFSLQHPEVVERARMLNIPVQMDEDFFDTSTPPPTVEVASQERKSTTPPLDSSERQPSSEHVEAATAVAQVLGVQVDDDTPAGPSKPVNEDVWKINSGINYKWKDWRLIRSRDSLFIWCDAVAIEFSDGSNGWLRFLMDGRLSTMYSSGSPESGADNAETRAEFLNKLQKAKSGVPSGSTAKTIFSNPHPTKKISSGNWLIGSDSTEQLVIVNKEGNQQKLIIKEDLPGFIFESSKHNKHCFMAESTLGLDFVTGWAARGGGRRLQFKTEAQKQKVHDLAKTLWDNYLKQAKTKPRDALVELQNAAKFIVNTLDNYQKEADKDKFETENQEKLLETLEYIRDAITNERLLSIFEISVSQIVPALLELLNEALKNTNGFVAEALRKAFSETKDLNCLIRKMVLVLESAEKFPQFLYDAPGGSPFGLQLLNRRLRFRLEQADPDSPHQKQFINRTNRLMKSEPLTTVGHLKMFLLKMLVKRWFDHPRETHEFVKQVKDAKKSKDKLNFEFNSDFDTNGIIWWLGSNGKTTEWTNPASVGVVNVACSDGSKQPYGQPEDILSRDTNALNCHTTDSTDANFTMDLGVLVYPNAYTLRHARGYGRSALRNWLFQGSRDGRVWDLLQCHANDQSLNEPGSTATWPIVLEQGQGPYRYFRIAQNGKNASGMTSYLSLSGFELYGDVVDVIEKPLPSLESVVTPSLKEKNLLSSSLSAVKKTIKKNTSSSKSSSFASGTPSKALPVPGLHHNRPPNAASVKAKKLQQKDAVNSLNPFGQNMNLTGTSPASAMAAEFDLYGQLPGGPDNNKLALGCSLRSLLSGMPNRSKALRYRRTNRLFGFNNTGSSSVVEPASPLSTETPPPPFGLSASSNSKIKIGSRVSQGHDWAWGSQGSNGMGTVMNGPDNGWVDVQWDDGTSNSYRFGFENKFDLEVKEAEEREPPSYATKSREQRIKERSERTMPHSSKTKKHVEDSKGFVSSKFANPATAKPENKAATLNLSATTSTTMSQKSMSTTNLFDEKKPTNASVSATNQAASAESLQHQTPSLENLLARSRVHDDRIPEVVGDDQSPVSTPEPTVESSKSRKTDSSFDTPISVAASSIAGGSQPVLSFTHAKNDGSSYEQLSFTETQSVTSSSATIAEVPRERDVLSTPRDENAPSSEDLTENSARNLANLSVSAPNLAPLVKRQRWSAGSASNDQEMQLAEEVEFEENLLRPIDEDTPLEETSQQATASVVQEIEVEVDDESTQTNRSTNENAKPGLEPNLVDELSFSDLVDVNYMNQIMNSREFYGELVDVYSEMMRAAESGNSTSNERDLLTNYVGSALLEELAMAENDMNEGNSSAQRTSAQAQPESALETQASSASAASANDNNPNRRNLSTFGSNLRSRLGNYADVLRNMMQQVIESGGSLHGFDADDIEEEFFDEEMTDEGNEDECDDFMNSNSNNTTVTTASVFQSQVESLANAAAALRRQFSNSSTTASSTMGSGFVSSTSATPGSTFGNGLNSATGPNDAKLNWRQIVMGEGSRLLYEVRPDGSVGQSDRANTGGRNSKRTLRAWDDDFVLKRQFGALIPAFDPRPGRTNINQTQDIELPVNDADLIQQGQDSSVSPSSSRSNIGSLNHPSKIKLYLKGPNLANVKDAIVELEDDEASIFAYVQKLMYLTEWGQKADKTRRIWEPTYTIIYENPTSEEGKSVVQPTPDNTQHADCFAPGTLVRKTMDVLNTLKMFAREFMLDINPETFVSTKITQKLTQELSDPLVVSARALPAWCDLLVYSYPCLFTIETRNIYLKATAFGTSRAIVWLQNRRDQILEQTRSATGTASSNLAGSRREDHYPEFRIGRIKHERIKVSRNNVFQDAIRVMKFHAARKSVLEIEYVGEEGTGLGPTLEFYALVAAEFQRKALAMWLCDDSDEQQAKLEGIEMDLGEGKKAAGYYVRRSGGLFPAPLPPKTEESGKIAELFRILGVFLAKALQDGRLVDIPLSQAFLKLLVSSEFVNIPEPNLEKIFTLSDLEHIHPVKGHFLGQLSKLVHRKRSIESDPNLDTSAKRRRIEELRLDLNGAECTVEDLALTFVVNPSSSVFEYNEYELIENGANIDVTIDNVDLYVEKCLDFYLNSGIKQQVSAFRRGFDLVFPLKSLAAFTPNEVQTLLSGDQRPEWTREDILKHTDPKLGYTRDSPGFLNFVEVLCGMNTEERKAFLQFTTGCSSLPPGGLANLHPRLTIVRKVDSGDGSYPSVNTCVHYLKLPEYSSAEILRERLLAATNEKGFHLN